MIAMVTSFSLIPNGPYNDCHRYIRQFEGMKKSARFDVFVNNTCAYTALYI